jgi:tripartite-type tricarboxylate transporter receptor subunit TctC
MTMESLLRAAAKLILPIVALSAAALPAQAQNYPSKPVRFIFPYAPGGTTEILARLIGTKLQASLGQPFVVEGKPGAGGNLGTDFVVKSAPDGYTILLGASGPLAINVTLFKSLPYDPLTDLVPVVHAASVPLVLVSGSAFPHRTVKELLAGLKARPEGIPYASAGIGTPQHLSAELFKLMTNSKGEHVAYKGSGPAINDLVANTVPYGFESMLVALPQIKGGKLRAIAMTASKRSPLIPDVPTMAEAGVPGYESIAWYGVMAPKGTSPAIVKTLNSEMRKAMAAPDLAKWLAEQGSSDVAGSPEQFGAFIKSEIGKWAKVVKASGATVD